MHICVKSCIYLRHGFLIWLIQNRGQLTVIDTMSLFNFECFPDISCLFLAVFRRKKVALLLLQNSSMIDTLDSYIRFNESKIKYIKEFYKSCKTAFFVKRSFCLTFAPIKWYLSDIRMRTWLGCFLQKLCSKIGKTASKSCHWKIIVYIM